MHWDFTSLSFLYLLAGSTNLVVSGINLSRPHARKGTYILSLALLATGLWLYAGFLEMAVVEPEYKYIFFVTVNSFLALVSPLTLFFIIIYFNYATRITRWLWPIWLFSAIGVVIGLTNSSHHWFWTDFEPGPPGSNVIFVSRGPFFNFAIIYFSGLVFASIVLLIIKSFNSFGWERRRALFIMVALVAPFGAFVFFAISADRIVGLNLMPMSYAVTALIIGITVLQDFRYEVNEKTKNLEISIFQLKNEIEKRQQLEHDLLQAHDKLSIKLASQSSKLAGLYDLILLNNNITIQFDLPQTSLAKISDIINCRNIIYLELNEQQKFQLVSTFGSGFDPSIFSVQLDSDWLPFTPDVLSLPSLNQVIEMPKELKQPENDSALIKWVRSQKRPSGIVCAFWEANYQFSVEEIALFGTATDALGLIIDNSRLRQEIAINATNEERRRLARDLHDSVTQSLHSLVLSSQTALTEIENPDRLQKILRRLDVSARQSLKEMRLLLFELRLVPFNKVGLVELITNRLEAVENRAGIVTEIKIDPMTSWPKAWDAQLYPIAIESLNNSLKHSRATHVVIQISGTQGNLVLEIKDNGIGFNMDTIPQGGMGLKSIAERCEFLGAILEIISKPANGTLIRVKIQQSIEFKAI